MKEHGEYRCEATTSRGTRCKCPAAAYWRYTDGREYLACKRHAQTEFFKPIARPERQP